MTVRGEIDCGRILAVG